MDIYNKYCELRNHYNILYINIIMNKLYMNLSTKPQFVKPNKRDVNANINVKIPNPSLRNMLGRIQGVRKGCSACGK